MPREGCVTLSHGNVFRLVDIDKRARQTELIAANGVRLIVVRERSARICPIRVRAPKNSQKKSCPVSVVESERERQAPD